MVASETVAMDVLGYRVVRDLKPGEAMYVDQKGKLHLRQCTDNPKLHPCIFEYVYFSRPDSVIDQVSVYSARLRMGQKLAKKIKGLPICNDIDVIVPIPDTSRVSAQAIAEELGVKFREGFMKNRYIGRTFIMPGQKERKKSVRQKLNPVKAELQGKNVLLVDDSIVRGTTSREIIEMARDAGAKKVFIASSAPPVRYPNVYGIDMPSANELIAYDKTESEVSRLIGADFVIYQDLDELVDSVKQGNTLIDKFDCAVFDGHYVTGGISDSYLKKLDINRNDGTKNSLAHDSGVVNQCVGLHNSDMDTE
jgi:amidophosphoribosyltransferase